MIDIDRIEGLIGYGNIPEAWVQELCAEVRSLREDAERYRKWVSYSGFTKEHADATLDAVSMNEHAAKEPK